MKITKNCQKAVFCNLAKLYFYGKVLDGTYGSYALNNRKVSVREELDLLGTQLMLALRLQESGFDPTLKMQDDVEHGTHPAQDIFSAQDDRWFMRPESIPGHLAIKAIAVDKENVYLETSPIIPEKVRHAIEERMLPFSLQEDADGFVFVDLTTQKKLITIGAPEKPEVEGLGVRCLWTIPTFCLAAVRKDAVIRIVDTVYTIDAYVVEADDVEVGPVVSEFAAQRITIQLQLGLQQRLQMEQRPLLSLSHQMAVTGQATTTLELRQIMAINRRLIQMSADELPVFFNRFIAEHGESAAMRVAIFAVAGKVKQTRPSLTWREARQVARKLVYAK